MTNFLQPKYLIVFLIPLILLVMVLALSTSAMPGQMTIDVKDLNDNEISPTQYKGKIQFIEFMATWCSTCKEVTNNVKSILTQEQITDVIFWSISTDPAHDQVSVFNKYITDNGLSQFKENGSWIFARDTDFLHEYYEISPIPHSFLIDKDLNIVEHKLGILSESEILDWVTSLS